MDRPLPAYTHIPRITPHPIRDPAGHSFIGPQSLAEILAQPVVHDGLTSANLSEQPDFQWAVRLFNAGYYWEAHEAWESLWHCAGRTGCLADYLKGLIKLAAAGVKLREHNANGVDRHAQRAGELFQFALDQAELNGDGALALGLPRLIAFAERLNTQPPPFPGDRTGKPVAAFPRLPLSISPTNGP